MTARVHDERVQRSKSDSGSKLGLTAPSLADGQGDGRREAPRARAERVRPGQES
jgi:hypothetical protein